MIILLDSYDRDEIVQASYRVSKHKLVAYAHTEQRRKMEEIFKRLNVVPTTTSTGWDSTLDGLFHWLKPKAYRLVVVDLLDDVRTPRSRWSDLAAYASIKDAEVWCCANKITLPKTLLSRVTTMSLGEAEERWDDT